MWSIVDQKGTNILIFFIFEFGGERSAESGARNGISYLRIVFCQERQLNKNKRLNNFRIFLQKKLLLVDTISMI